MATAHIASLILIDFILHSPIAGRPYRLPTSDLALHKGENATAKLRLFNENHQVNGNFSECFMAVILQRNTTKKRAEKTRFGAIDCDAWRWLWLSLRRWPR